MLLLEAADLTINLQEGILVCDLAYSKSGKRTGEIEDVVNLPPICKDNVSTVHFQNLPLIGCTIGDQETIKT